MAMAKKKLKRKPKRKRMPVHKEVDLPIKTAKVDALMVPVLNWLNSFADVQTCACCEGYDEEELPDDPDDRGYLYTHEPYVSFTCNSMESLITIFQRIEPDDGDDEVIARGEVDWNSNASSGLGGMNFCLRFFSKPRLREFIETRLNANRYRAKLHRLGFVR
jgi:hypothetical protein